MLMISRKTSLSLLALLALLVTLACCLPALAASKTGQKSYPSPEAAVKNLVTALKNEDRSELSAILGPGSETIVSSGDPVADRAGKDEFLRLYQEKNVLKKGGPSKRVLEVGKEDYPFPIPIIKKGKGWVFDTKAGKEELLNRRIGRNELETIAVVRTYVDAQREYASEDRGGGKVLEFAQKFRSTPGKKDGLYWEVTDGEKESPLGPFVAKAAEEGYLKQSGGTPAPFHGYLFKILKGQGKDAPGGAFDYVVNGKMVLGFGLVAYPAQYGNSGVMTFIVNQDGIVYQKNLGKNTEKIANEMKLYNPDKTWKKVPAGV